MAKSTRTQCRVAYMDWALSRVDEFTEQAQESKPTPVWDLAKRLFCRKRPGKRPRNLLINTVDTHKYSVLLHA